jgi:hypothetical protein
MKTLLAITAKAFAILLLAARRKSVGAPMPLAAVTKTGRVTDRP